MTYIPGAMTSVGPGDLSVTSISQFTLVTPSDMTVTDLSSIATNATTFFVNGINLSNLSSYQTVWSGVTRNILWVP